MEAIVKAAEDSIIHLNQIKEQEAIQREQIFAALGDTAFNGVCFGMTEKQYTKAFQAFKKPLKTEGTFYDFELAGYEFRGYDVSHVEKNNHKNYQGYPIGLEKIMEEDDELWTYCFKDKLFSIRWNSDYNFGSAREVKRSLEELVSLFEKKYGKPNKKDLTGFSHNQVIANWETKDKKITIYYESATKRKWVTENYPSDYQYEVKIIFLDKSIKKEVDEYIKPIIQKFIDEMRKKQRQDSIRNANAL
ncbi:MAG: hypothetical protein J6X31_07185 [Bacteroidales bacterium]|nr:hypothetical protein [Bacteroidales bacterium]